MNCPIAFGDDHHCFLTDDVMSVINDVMTDNPFSSDSSVHLDYCRFSLLLGIVHVLIGLVIDGAEYMYQLVI